MKKELKKEIKKFLSDFDKAKNEDWFEWLQDAIELLNDSLEEKE